jgi:hypothetical protein
VANVDDSRTPLEGSTSKATAGRLTQQPGPIGRIAYGESRLAVAPPRRVMIGLSQSLQ